MIFYYKFDEYRNKYIKQSYGNEELPSNKSYSIDGTGDNFKIIVFNNIENAIEPNTIVQSFDEENTETWWVVKEDKSSKVNENLYKHETQLVGAIEWFGFKFAYTGTFYYHRYCYGEIIDKLLNSLWKTTSFTITTSNFYDWFGVEKNNQKLSFKGYTVRNCLKEIEKLLNINLVVKFRTEEQADYEYISNLYFEKIEKSPITSDVYNLSLLNEKQQISLYPSRSYGTRVVGRNQQVTVTNSVEFPTLTLARVGSNEKEFDITENTCSIILPYNIERVDSISFYPNLKDKNYDPEYRNNMERSDNPNITPTLENRKYTMQMYYKGSASDFLDYYYLMEKQIYDLAKQGRKDSTFWYEKGTNVIHVSKNFFNRIIGKVNNTYFEKVGDTRKGSFSYELEDAAFRIKYRPYVSEALITKDNIPNKNDDVIYNQTGQNADALLTKDFVDSYVESLSSGSLTKSKFFDKESEAYKVGSVFIDGEDRYVLSSVSIDKYYDKVYCEFKLSRYYVAKTEMLSADGSIESYAIPLNSTLRRIQEYKDLIRFNENNVRVGSYNDEIYKKSYNTKIKSFINFSKPSDDYILYGSSILENSNIYFANDGIKFSGNKSTSYIYDLFDNNVCGFYVVDKIQIPYNYVDENGENYGFTLKLISQVPSNVDNTNYPFISQGEYTSAVESVYINESKYRKDAYEVPVFQYTMEYLNGNGFVFGSQILNPKDKALFSLKLYTSEGQVFRELTDFSTLQYKFNFANKVFIDEEKRTITLKHENVGLDYEPTQNLLFKGKNLIVTRINVFEDDTFIEEMLFAKNNLQREFGYSKESYVDPDDRQTYWNETYTWTIYLETWKV